MTQRGTATVSNPDNNPRILVELTYERNKRLEVVFRDPCDEHSVVHNYYLRVENSPRNLRVTNEIDFPQKCRGDDTRRILASRARSEANAFMRERGVDVGGFRRVRTSFYVIDSALYDTASWLYDNPESIETTIEKGPDSK